MAEAEERVRKEVRTQWVTAVMEFSMNGWMTLTICSAPMETATLQGEVLGRKPQGLLLKVVKGAEERTELTGLVVQQTPEVGAVGLTAMLQTAVQEETEVRAI